MFDQLSKQLAKVEKRCRRLWYLQWFSLAMVLLGVTSWLLNEPILSQRFAAQQAIPFLVAIAAVTIYSLRVAASRYPLPRESVATRIEALHPELGQRLVTAVALQKQNLSYLESEVIRQSIEHGRTNDWRSIISERRMRITNLVSILSLLFCALSFANTYQILPTTINQLGRSEIAFESEPQILIEPGNVEVESGTQLVITARYAEEAPNQATLIVTDSQGNSQNYTMVRNLDDPVLGVVLPNIESDFQYQVVDQNWTSSIYQANVFTYPELVRSDATINYPEYTKLETKRIENTIRVAAVEGSKIKWGIYLNKEVKEATLLNEQTNTNLKLTRDESEKLFYTAELTLRETQRLSLAIVDHDGRKNKYPPELVAKVIENEPPTLKPTLAGDSTVSPLEEFPVAAEVKDDFGILQFGLTYTFANAPPKDVLLGGEVIKGAKQNAEHLISFEDLSAVPDDLLTYHFWAEDFAPDGSVRRSESDLFFAEVRPFDEIFREQSAQQQAAQSESSQEQSQSGQQAEELANLQKEIINATWRLLREQDSRAQDESFINDLQLVVDSQNDALGQAQEMSAELSDDRSIEFLELAMDAMRTSVQTLQSLLEKPQSDTLRNALETETQAYSALLKLRAREFEVTQSQQQSQSSSSSSSSQNRRQQQLDQLELEQEEERYETESQAAESSQQEAENRETRQVLNRLRDLARRQQDLNDAIAQLQTTLEQADEPEKKEEATRQLKRLREQQEELLRETDELAERLQENSDQQEMNEAAERLEQTRDQVQQAAQELASDDPSEALTAGRRAEREFEAMRDEFRQRASGQFNERMRQLQSDAQQLSSRQQELSADMEQPESPTQSPSGLRAESNQREEVTTKLREQAEDLESILQTMQETVEDAEETEPLLAQKLYDAFRESNQRQTRRQLEESANLLDRGFQPQSKELAEAATEGIESLRASLDEAAESVLGDEINGLQAALSELERLEAELQGELERNQPRSDDSSNPETQYPSGEDGGARSDSRQAASQDSQQNGEQQDGSRSSNREPSETPQGNNASNQQSPNDASGSMPQNRNQPSDGQPLENSGDQTPQNPNGQQQGSQQSGSQQSGSQQPNSESSDSQPSDSAQGSPNQQTPPNGSPSDSSSQQAPSQQATGQQATGQSPGDGESQNPSMPNGNPQNGSQNGSSSANNLSSGSVFNQLAAGTPSANPITGDGFRDWSDRLRDVEEMVSNPELRSEAAQIRERARDIRRENRRQSREPQWEMVEEMIATPLRELKKRVSDELMRRSAEKNAVVPLDRDPVPERFQDAVRTYYERLGSGQ